MGLGGPWGWGARLGTNPCVRGGFVWTEKRFQAAGHLGDVLDFAELATQARTIGIKKTQP